MIDFKNIENMYFVGAGGIGMSALARYFLAGGYNIGGYDRTPTMLTARLAEEGCVLQYDDDPGILDQQFKDPEKTLVVYTPAIKDNNRLLSYFRAEGYGIYKRAALLGLITEKSTAIAVAGTHGKTSITTLTAHLLKQSQVDCSAFLGGISRNYDTNMLTGSGDLTVVEADEYDRSFHSLSPYMALITSLDPDHLDIYGNLDNMVEAYNTFAAGIREGGSLIVNNKIRGKIKSRAGLQVYTYGLDQESDFRVESFRIEKEAYHFSLITPSGVIPDLISTLPGRLNLENTLAAVSLANMTGVSDDEIRKALIHYKGVKRRLDIRYNDGNIIYIDDYAHHPGELDYLVESIREFYGEKHITIVFQPHLFTRTRDHASSFARSLDNADRVILLPIYPAREEPIEGISSQLIGERMQKDSIIIEKEKLPAYLGKLELEILLTAGAGDIDTLVEPIEGLLKGGGR